MPTKKRTGKGTSRAAPCCGPDCCGGGSSCCGSSTAGPCRVDAVVAVDARGQMVIPKELRTKFGIGPDDRLALVSWERNGTPCCLTLLRADELAESVRRTYGPVLGDAVAR